MQMEMTNRDKKLLIFLSLFVIIVGFGYWGIYPMAKSIKQIDSDIETAKIERDANDMKIMQLPMQETLNEELEENIIDVRNNFYPMLTSDEIDKMFTNMVLDYNLYAYSLDIQMPTVESQLDPYRYSEKALNPEEEFEVSTEDSDAETSNEEGTDEVFTDEEVSTGIFNATVSMRLGGDEAMLQKLINDLSTSDQKHLLRSYSWDKTSSSSLVYENDEYDLKVLEDVNLNLVIDIYMCQE